VKKLLIVTGVVLALFAGLIAATVFLPESPDRLANSLTNPRPEGARALGQVLAQDGVAVNQTNSIADIAAAPADSTVAVVLETSLSEDEVAALTQTPADLVVIYSGSGFSTDPGKLAGGRLGVQDWSWGYPAPNAECADADALAAGRLSGDVGYGLVAFDDRVMTCFADGSYASLYADLTTSRHRVTVVAGLSWIRNSGITDMGNAALALRTLGRHDRLTWYLPADRSPTTVIPGSQDVDSFELLPPWSRPVFGVLLAAAAAAALWQGRRFGALVREPLPVEVPASEASAGLARLYRQAGARGHAAAALRAATIQRVAARVGVTTSDAPDTVISQLAQASGADPAALTEALYGPPPTTDTGLAILAETLTDLERKLSSR